MSQTKLKVKAYSDYIHSFCKVGYHHIERQIVNGVVPSKGSTRNMGGINGLLLGTVNPNHLLRK
ncbi:MAG: hypothetical protein ACFFAB_18065 [Candidatus Heimdallarchaeota archaeon]